MCNSTIQADAKFKLRCFFFFLAIRLIVIYIEREKKVYLPSNCSDNRKKSKEIKKKRSLKKVQDGYDESYINDSFENLVFSTLN